jgi:hypothetical protein
MPPRERLARREYTIRITKPLRETLDGLAKKYDLYTAEGAVRDAEIVRVLLICALTEGWTPREQAAVALYVNGLMLVSQGLWLGLHDVRDDLAETMQSVLREGIEPRVSLPENPPRDPERGRFHVKVDDWIRNRLVTMARVNNFVHEDGTILDAAFVVALTQRAIDHPEIYWQAFMVYARGITQVRRGLTEGLLTVRDSLCEAVTTAAGEAICER